MNLPEHETGRAIGNLSKEPCLTTELFRLTIINHYKRNFLSFKWLSNFLVVLKEKSHRRTVAHFRGAEILDRAGILIKCVESKCLAHRSEFQIRTTVEIHKGFLNHRLHLAVTTLHVHHHCDRYAACNPVFALCCEVAHGAHVAGKARIDKHSRVEAESISVVCIEVCRVGATSFITEEVMLRAELA